MRVYNKGSRLFTYHSVELPPRRFTTIPVEHEDGIKKLLVSYPEELVDGGSMGQDIATKDALIAQLTKDNTILKGQVAKLQALLVGQPQVTKSAETLAAAVTGGEAAPETAPVVEESAAPAAEAAPATMPDIKVRRRSQ